MTPFVRMLALTVCIAALAAPAAAQDALSRRVSLDLKAMAPGDAFKVLADSVGLKVAVHADVTVPVDILVKNVTAKTALTTICESIGCRWTVAAGTITVRPAGEILLTMKAKRGEETARKERARATVDRIKAALKQTLPADMKFENAPLDTVSSRLSEALGITLSLTSGDPHVRTLTADFGNQTLISALESLAAPSDQPVPWRIGLTDKDAAGNALKSPTIMIAFRPATKKK